MHIPDGYLSPSTSIVLGIISAPFLIKAYKKLTKKSSGKIIPTIALFSSLSFVIMMFNVPLPGGTTGHATGATIASIILGPWLAMFSMVIALIIQALFFGDGGILTLGTNIFNMGIVTPLTGYYMYHFLKKLSGGNRRKEIFFSSLAGYIAINAAALLAGIELGIQPILFHNAAGQALYFPYPMQVSIPAMLLGHLTLAGLAEAIFTATTLSWIYKTNPGLIPQSNEKTNKKKGSFIKWAMWPVLALILLSPLGLLAPGTAWGEWGRKELGSMGLEYIPSGFDKWSNLWKAPLPKYDLPIFHNSTIGYIFSGAIGVAVSIGLIFAIYYLIQHKKNPAR